MCGFLVEFRKKDIPFSLNRFKKAGNLISHRGPDDDNFINLIASPRILPNLLGSV